MNNWKEQIKSCITQVEQISQYITLTESEYEAMENKKFQITPYMMRLIAETDCEEALRKQFVPFNDSTSYKYSADYLNELKFQPIPNLIHKYKNRVIIIATNKCACYCQFCTRQRVTCRKQYGYFDKGKILDYIKQNREINDVLITGGDPLILETHTIVSLIDSLSEIDHIKVIRIGTRIPITLPMRIEDELVNALRKYKNLYINIHINHPVELRPESRNAISRLVNAGIPIGSQTVFLKGINDNLETLRCLFEELISIKVKPYYLYQCDKVSGCESFISNPQKGISIINTLSQEISGFAVPKFVIDTPEAGKMILAPCHLQNLSKDAVYMKTINRDIVYSTSEFEE